MGQQWPAAGSGALSVAVCPWDILKEVAIIFITSTIVLSQVKQWGGGGLGRGTQPCPSTENWIKDILSMASSIKIRTNFLHSQSLPSESFHNTLIIISQRVDRIKNTVTEN